MHESSLGKQVLEAVLERARAEQAERVLCVRGWVAETEHLNPDSLRVIENAVVEPGVAEGRTGDFYQFERVGYFTHEKHEGDSAKPVLNRTVSLRDTWARKHAS